LPVERGAKGREITLLDSPSLSEITQHLEQKVVATWQIAVGQRTKRDFRENVEVDG
jgi:hypothetical protein